jgi:hypothetical protein
MQIYIAFGLFVVTAITLLSLIFQSKISKKADCVIRWCIAGAFLILTILQFRFLA